MTGSTASATALARSPFVGVWRAIDFGDGSLMRATILGPAGGPFLITWTESYFTFCDGRAGVATGIGRLNADNPQVLEADLRLKCFRTGDEVSWHQIWQYRPTYDDLVSQETPGVETIWKRLSQPIVPRATFTAYVPGAVEGYAWPMGHTITLDIPDRGYTTQAVSEQEPGSPEGETRVLFEVWKDGFELTAGDHVFLADESIGLTKDVVVTNLAVTDFDTSAGTVTGVFDPAYDLWVWLYGEEGQVPATEGDVWTATFGELPPGAWGGATQWDIDGDGTSIDFQVPVTLTVTSTGDVVADDGVCTLREAIIAANTNSPSGAMDGECPAGLESQTDTVALAAGATYSLVIDSTDEDGAFDGDLDIWDNSPDLDLILKVEGDGHAIVSQDASMDDRVLDIMATVELRGLTLTGGGRVNAGAGVQNTGTLVLEASSVSGNVADGSGGGLFNMGMATIRSGSDVSGNSAGWAGGGIYNANEATLTVDSSAVSSNSATSDGGGGLYNDGALTVTNSTVSGNSAIHDGGGIANRGALTVDASTISANAGQGGAGIANGSGATAVLQNGSLIGGDPGSGGGNTASGTGGGLFNYGTFNVVGSAVSGNSAPYGGGIANWGGDMTLTQAEVSSNSASASAGGIHNKDGGTTTVEDGSVISGNTAIWDGGGINNWDGTVTLSDSTVSGNSAGQSGGGILNLAAGSVAVDASTLSDNSASDGGGLANWGGIATIADSAVSTNRAAWGGGIAIYGGTLTLDSATVTHNQAENDAGGIHIKDGATVTIQSGSDISDNVAAWGGGISNWGSMLTIDASAISGNSVDNSGGGILNKDGGTTIVQNGSVVSENTAKNEGGISNWGGSTLAVEASAISANEASDSSGGLGNLGTVTVNNSSVTGNSAPWGAGLWNRDGTMTVDASTISGNSASNGGGGILNWEGELTVTGSALLGNSSEGEGDAVYSSVGTVNATNVTGSCIVGNGNTAIFNELTAMQNASGNWWGDADGPGGVGPGSGDSVSLAVDFSGWLFEPVGICVSP